MTHAHDAEPPDPETAGISPGRLTAFSDGIIAIAATLLVLEIRVPTSRQPVWATLWAEWPALASYVISFLVIGIAWIHHHNMFHHVRRVDRGVMLLNLGLLISVGFLPLPTAVLGLHHGGTQAVPAAVLYALSLAGVSVWYALLWKYLSLRPALLVPGALPQVQRARRRSLAGPTSYLCAAGLGTVSPNGSLLLIAWIVLYYMFGRRSPSARTHLVPAPGAQPPAPDPAYDGTGIAHGGLRLGR